MAAGFTILELLIVCAILAIVASVGVPQYLSALRIARVGKAKHELVLIAKEVDQFVVRNGGHLPLTLYQVGFGGRSDPWGKPYCYLNYTDGTGDGLDWAIAAGIVDPSAFQSAESGSGATPRRLGAMTPRPQGLLGGLVRTVEQATRTVTGIVSGLLRPLTPAETEALITTVARSPEFTMYVGVPAEATRRRDRYMFPLNTDYDLFSLGPDKRTAVSLGEGVGLDDVIRANNGGYFGLAGDY
jgi:general secretion pathway protein G